MSKRLFFGAFALVLGWFTNDGRAGVTQGVPLLPAVATANANNNRDGWFSQERILTLSNVGGGTFGKLSSWSVTGRVTAQMLIAPGVVTANGTKDLIIVATIAGNIYAFDVNNVSASPYWTATLGGGFSNSVSIYYSESMACVSTPAVDLANSLLYAVCANSGNSWVLYKLNLANGNTITSVTISGQYPGTGDPMGGDTVIGGKLQFKANSEFNRAALTLTSGNVYIGFGSVTDQRPWHGWVFAYAQSDLSQQAVFCTTPSSYGGGVWGAGAGFSLDAAGSLYAFLGNGGYDGVTAYGNSIIKLSPALAVLDWFTPSNWATLESNDSDLSSSRAMLMKTANGSTLVVGGAKDYRAYVVDSLCMGHLQGSGSGCTSPQLWLTSMISPGGDVGVYGGTFASFSFFAPNVAGNLWRFDYSPSTGLYNQSGTATMGTWPFPGAHCSYSSNGAFNGILWATTVATSAHSSAKAGTLRAFNPATMGEIFNSDPVGGDALGQLNKFNPPLVWNGKVYVGTGSSVYVYGLGAH